MATNLIIAVTLYILYILLLFLFPEHLHFMKSFIFYSALPALNLGETRAILALSITIDRIIVAISTVSKPGIICFRPPTVRYST